MSGANRYLAAGTLSVTSLLYFSALPFESTFVGGLAVSVFGAAMVGGLADWFAVSALFRKPLGIPWRTAVIPRNRQRLFSVIVQMVKDELLSKENIKRKIEEHNISAVVLAYIEERGGAKTIKRMVHKLLSDVLEKIDADEAGQFIVQLIRQDVGSIRLAPLIRSIGEWTIQAGYDQKIISFAAGEMAHIAAKPDFRGLVADFLREVLARYEGDRQRRRLFNNVAGISPDRLAEVVQRRLVEWLLQFKATQHPIRNRLRQRFCRYLERLSQPGPAQELECWKDQLVSDLDLVGLTKKAIVWLKNQASERPLQTAAWFRQADRLIDQLLLDFRNDQIQQYALSGAIKQGLITFIDSHHEKIGSLVYERLAQFSDAELVDFIETRVGEDLQIIRVNGSIIGGLTGGVIHCLTFWL